MSIVPRSVAFDEGPNPQPQPWAELYVVGPRTTPEQAAAIRQAGSRLVVKVQPVSWLRSDGTHETGWPWDVSLWPIPTLKAMDGSVCTLAQPGQGMEGSCVLDFGTSFGPSAFAQVVEQLCNNLGAIGVLFDYGCSSLQGMVVVEPPSWDRWISGWQRCRASVQARKLRVWNACNRQFIPGASLCIEGINPAGSDTGWPPNVSQALRLATDNPGAILLVQGPDVVQRKLIVAAALLSGASVDYRPAFWTGDRVSREPAPELLMPPYWTCERLAGVL